MDYSQADDSGIGRFIVWIAILGIINLLSYALDWPFWVY